MGTKEDNKKNYKDLHTLNEKKVKKVILFQQEIELKQINKIKMKES
jgi:hypothetical protein